MIVESTENGFFIVLEKGEKLMASLDQFVLDNNLSSGQYSGIGALENVELGYYDLHNKEYLRKTFQGDYELLHMAGSNNWIQGEKLFNHIHCLISGSDFHVLGGHLFEAEVAVTAEIYWTSFGHKKLHREYVENIGLNLIQSCGQV